MCQRIVFIVYDEGLFAGVEGIVFNVFLWLQVLRHVVAGNITCLHFTFLSLKNRKSCDDLYWLEHEKQFPAAMQWALHHIQCLFKVYWTFRTSLSNITLANLISFLFSVKYGLEHVHSAHHCNHENKPERMRVRVFCSLTHYGLAFFGITIIVL